MHRITLQPTEDLDAVGRRWRNLEAQAAGSFFQSWTWLGCLAGQRFAGAQLLAVMQDDADVALALVGRRRAQGWLNETGDTAQDCVFIEHNGLLASPDAAESLPGALRVARGRGRLVLSGVDASTLGAASQAGWLRILQSRLAPQVALAGLREDYLATLSGNARAQIRRSQRLYGPELRLARAGSAAEAAAFFEEMVVLHQAAWGARGRPGAFAPPHMLAFHRALIARAWGQGEADLLRVAAGARHLGTLYMLIRNGHVASYQSGFAYTDDAREKPGLVCHALAIAHYAAAGARTYDLLAGAERYKLTLAPAGPMMHWAVLDAPWSARGVAATARSILAEWRGRQPA